MNDELLDRVCTRHSPYGERAAKANATARRAAGDPVSAFLCPFCHEWHVGHGPSLATMHEIAEAIRERSGNQPKEHQQHGTT